MRKRAIFLDKDGTLIKDIPHNIDPKKMEIFPETQKALHDLKKAGFLLIGISNQAGIAKGFFSKTEFERSLEVLQNMLNVDLDDFYFCPHHPEGIIQEFSVPCSCRKPQPGMLITAAQEHDIELSASWMIGDILNDIEAGKRVGCRTVLLNKGNETEWFLSEIRVPDITAKNLKEAADFIIKTGNKERREFFYERRDQIQY